MSNPPLRIWLYLWNRAEGPVVDIAYPDETQARDVVEYVHLADEDKAVLRGWLGEDLERPWQPQDFSDLIRRLAGIDGIEAKEE